MNNKFYKYHGAGNDFILIDARTSSLDLTAEVVKNICDRHTGIGADGFVSLETDETAQFYARCFDANGTQYPISGDAARTAVLFARHIGAVGDTLTFNSLNGIRKAEVISADQNKGRVKVEMPEVNGFRIAENYVFMDTGSPNYVEFVNNIDDIDVFQKGKLIKNSDKFSSVGGVNVNFVQIMANTSIKVRSYGLSADNEVYALSEGVVASVLATNLLCYPNQKKYDIFTRGGEFNVSFKNADNQSFMDIFLEGDAVRIFECELNLDNLRNNSL